MQTETKAEFLEDLQDLYDLACCGVSILDEPFDDPDYLLGWIEEVKSERYPTGKGWNYVPKKSNWCQEVLRSYDDLRFKRTIRMSKDSFFKLVSLIENSPVFQNSSKRKQTAVTDQALIALYRLGHSGTGTGVRGLAVLFGVSEGHVLNCTRRFLEAVTDLTQTFIKWPSAEEKEKESKTNDQRQGFVGCIGKIDGTMIVLNCKPGRNLNSEANFNRKRRYAFNVIAVCDSNKKFTFLYAGHSGATHEMRVFEATDVYKQSSSYFAPNEYLLGDAAYTSSNIIIPPYKSPATDDPLNRNFNYYHSRVMIDIEHSFEILKKRFPSLSNLRALMSRATYEHALKWIVSCFVLHNFLITEMDLYEDTIYGDEVVEENSNSDIQNQSEEADDSSRDGGLREYIKARVLNHGK